MSVVFVHLTGNRPSTLFIHLLRYMGYSDRPSLSLSGPLNEHREDIYVQVTPQNCVIGEILFYIVIPGFSFPFPWEHGGFIYNYVI